MFQSLDHVILGVGNLDAASAGYARLLGRGPSWRGEHPTAGSANTLFRLANTYLELLSPKGEGPVGRLLTGWLDSEGEGPVGLALGCADAQACRAALAARGLAPEPVEEGLGRDVESGAFRRWRRVPLPLASTRGVLLFGIEHTSPPELLPIVPPAGDEAATVYGLDHAVVQTPDPDSARALYGDGLGLRLALDKQFEEWGVRLLFFRVGGVTIELAAQLKGQPGDPGRDRLWGLSYRVRDADAARARLAELGFDVSEVRTGRRPGTRVFSVREGTCGVPTLVLEPPPKDDSRSQRQT